MDEEQMQKPAPDDAAMQAAMLDAPDSGGPGPSPASIPPQGSAPMPSAQQGAGQPSFLNISPEQLASQEDAARNRRETLAMMGGITNALANQHSFGEYYLGHMNPNVDYSKTFTDIADAKQDPLARQKALLEAYQNQLSSKRSSAELDPNSDVSKNARTSYKNLLSSVSPKLASSIPDNASVAQLREMLPFIDKAMSTQGSMGVEQLRAQNAKDVESMRNKGDIAKLQTEYTLKNQYGLPLPPEEALKLGSNQNAIDAIKDLKATINANKGSFGPVAGRISALDPNNQNAKDYQNQMQVAATKIGTALGNGQLNGRMYKNYQEMVPDLTARPDVAISQLDTLQRQLEQKHANDVGVLRSRNTDLRGIGGATEVSSLPTTQGKKPAGGSTPSAQAAPTTGPMKTVNGVLYMKVDGGWKAQ